MQKVVLIFPDTIKLSDFIIKNQIGPVEVNTREQTLNAELEDEEILIACSEEYEAIVDYTTPSKPIFLA
jgi:hypothetical protein